MDFNDFDKRFKQTQRVAVGVMIAGWVITLGLIGFGVWVVVKLLAHFGVIA